MIESEFTENWRKKLINYINTRLKSEIEQETLRNSMLYSLDAGGKRIRPLLYLATVSTLDEIIPEVDLPIAAAIELVHTYSLIHDDLPAMDNDDLRRGKATNHKVFGDAIAILAGDGLLTQAFQWLSYVRLAGLDTGKLCGVLAIASGPQGMVAGQVIDIESTGHELKTIQEVQKLDALKTGALLSVPFDLAAVRLGLSSKQHQALREFGQHYGVAFQIMDDLQDLQGDTEKLGKQTKKDVKAGKNTYPRLIGIAEAKTALHREVTLAKNNLSNYRPTTNWVQLMAYLDYFKEV